MIMKKILGIIVLGMLLSGSAYAGLFSFKTYAKCDFKYQAGGMDFSIFKEFPTKIFQYMAFDDENLYFKYNIANKEFDKLIKHDSGKKPIKTSNYLYNIEGNIKFRLQFDGTEGTLKLMERDSYWLSDCKKISKSKFPKSKF